MARPKEQLIERNEVIETALEIIDRDGIDALSMRTLASALNVKAGSFYHHFKNKDEILEGVARLVFNTRAPSIDRRASWQDQMAAMFLAAASVLDLHPNIVSVLVRRSDRHFATHVHNHAALILQKAGFPPDLVLPLIDSQDALLIGMIVIDSNEPSAVAYTKDSAEFPELHAAVQANRMTASRRRELAIRALIAGWTAYLPSERKPAKSAKKAKT